MVKALKLLDVNPIFLGSKPQGKKDGKAGFLF